MTQLMTPQHAGYSLGLAEPGTGRDRHSLTMLSRTTPIGRKSIPPWQDRFRDPSLTALLIIQICLMFVVAPLVAQGLPMAREVGEALLLVAALIVVLLSRSHAAIVIILLGLAAVAAGFLFTPELSGVSATLLTRGGGILAISALAWVVVHAVCAWPHYPPADPRRIRVVSRYRRGIHPGLLPDLGTEPGRVRKPPRPYRRPQRCGFRGKSPANPR
jgi:hypothetical protein